MGTGKDLNDEEKGKIAALSMAGWNTSKIATAIKRSRKVISNNLRNPKMYGNGRKNGGSRGVVTPIVKRQIRTMATKTGKSSRAIRNELKLSCHPSRVRAVLTASSRHKYRKAMSAPALTAGHKLARMEWAKKCVTYMLPQW